MKKCLQCFFILFSSVFLPFSEAFSQTAACSGTLTATSVSVYGSGYTQIGNGTSGSIKVCISSNSMDASCMGTADVFVLDDNASGTTTLWTSSTANGTCYTFTTTTGYAYLAMQQDGCGGTGTATISWSTVNGSGSNVCPTCSDGIQNGTETGVDCGGTCTACAGSCFNGIQDGTETGVDCGGSCAAVCGTCFDGIKNGTETGVDCGGSCSLACTTNTGTVSTSCSCPAAATATVYPTVCDQVGTTAFDLNSPVVGFSGCASPTAPTSISCAASVSSPGTWVHLDLATGVNSVQLALVSGSMGSGNSSVYSAAYQGASCASLTQVSCQQAETFSSGTYGAYNVVYTGLDPSKDLWIYMFDDGGKSFTLNFQAIGTGTATAPTNTTCASASTATGNACNLGATGASFTPPNAGGQACSGGTWGSNENTTFYSFTPTASTASLSINSITCNDGTTGQAQFGIWTSCAAIGTYTSTSTWLGCAVGTGTISLTGLTAGNTYYIAADGFAGNDCKWDFAGTNIIILPVELSSFTAKYNNNQQTVDLKWSTATELNNRFFTIEKSKDAKNFEYVSTVPGAGNSNVSLRYSSVDAQPYDGVSYYRLKQTDYDGKNAYSYIVSVNGKKNNPVGDIKTVYAEGSITFLTTCEKGTELTYEIYDISGKEMANGTFVCTNSTNEIKLAENNFSKGIYFIKISDGENQKQEKFIKY
ncbi:MAG: T9SS type A sorting domain-containing protein [Bacteroidia bacterium]